MANNKHLTFSDRIIIEKGLNNNSSRKSITDTLGMDRFSICKEIKKHSFYKKFSRTGILSCGTYDCIHIKTCGFNSFFHHTCDKRFPIPCKTKDSSSGICNGCIKKSSCKLTKKLYKVQSAQKEYEYTLVNSRIGWDLSFQEVKKLADILSPLLEQGAFEQFGIKDINLRIKVKRKRKPNINQDKIKAI